MDLKILTFQCLTLLKTSILELCSHIYDVPKSSVPSKSERELSIYLCKTFYFLFYLYSLQTFHLLFYFIPMTLLHGPLETKATGNNIISPHQISVHPAGGLSPRSSFLVQWSGYMVSYRLVPLGASVSHPSPSSQELRFSPLFCCLQRFLPSLFKVNPLLL